MRPSVEGRERLAAIAMALGHATACDLDRVEPGDILITNATTPAFNAIVGILDGLVTTSGGPNVTAVVARDSASRR